MMAGRVVSVTQLQKGWAPPDPGPVINGDKGDQRDASVHHAPMMDVCARPETILKDTTRARKPARLKRCRRKQR